jgi:glycosyltransferase involved in cell wall biosynthesis
MTQVDARKKLGLYSDRKMLISVGALVERKGMHILIDALVEINRRGELAFDTYIIGKGEQKDKLQKLINFHGLSEKIKLFGEVKNSDLPIWYSAADISFLGTSREGWPNVVSESLACGAPVIATPVNGIPEIIRSDEYGLLVNRDTQSFADGILAGFNKPWDRQKIVDYGQSRPWSLVAKEVHTVFQHVLETGKL